MINSNKTAYIDNYSDIIVFYWTGGLLHVNWIKHEVHTYRLQLV